jgi:hypothetical protein
VQCRLSQTYSGVSDEINIAPLLPLCARRVCVSLEVAVENSTDSSLIIAGHTHTGTGGDK